MSTSGKDNGKKQQQQERWEQMKQERNYRGIICNTTESFVLIDISIPADAAIKRLRSGVFSRYTIEEVQPCFQAYNDALMHLFEVTTKLCKMTGVEIRKPIRGIESLRETHTLSPELETVFESLERTFNGSTAEEEGQPS